MKYSLINKIYNLPYSNLLTGFIKKRLLKKNNITFIPTNKKKLPKKNYPVQNTIEYQEKIIKSYNENKNVSFNTCPDLKKILKENFKSDMVFNFLDFGGDKIDFFLDISKEFKNINYYLINQSEVNEIISVIKDKYQYINLKILNNFEEVKKYSFDFVYFGSTIQYLENYEEYINGILPITKKNIFFSATWFFSIESSIKKVVVKQLNYLPHEFYLYFFNLKPFLNIFYKHQFVMKFEKINNSYSCSFKNFEDMNLKDIKYTDILFEKN